MGGIPPLALLLPLPAFRTARAGYNKEFDLLFSGLTSGATTEVADFFTRDTAGRVSRFGRVWGGLVPPDETFTYLPNGKLERRIGKNGTETFTYDTRGLVQALDIVAPGGTPEGAYTFGYDTLGRNNLLVFPDGHRREQAYDPQGRLTSRCYRYTIPSLDRCYTAEYDAVGNPIRMTDPEGVDVIAYDALDRLERVTRQVSGSPDVIEEYAYNGLGALRLNAGVVLDDRRPRLDGTGLADAPIPRTFNGNAVTLDGAGRITALDGATFVHRDHGPLHTATRGGTSVFYNMDGFGLRASRVPSAGTPELYWVDASQNVTAVISTSGATEERYLYDGIDHPLRRATSAGTQYYELDLAGNVRRLRGPGGADLGGYRYRAFGKAYPADSGTPTPTVDQPLRWKGRWLDPLTGLYDMRARQWSPELGVFLEVDELGYHDRRSTLWGWPGQNPVKFSDPGGTDGAVVSLIAFGAGAGSASLGGAAATAGLFVLPAAILSAAAYNIYRQFHEYNNPVITYAPTPPIPSVPSVTVPVAPTRPDDTFNVSKEHTKNARPSNEERHQKGQTRKKRDRDGEKGDARRPYKRSGKGKKTYFTPAFDPTDEGEEDQCE